MEKKDVLYIGGEWVTPAGTTTIEVVNNGMTIDLKNPFGGFKSSGIGRELGPEGLEAYLEVQTIVLS